MDPISAAGIGLSVTSLVLQVFAGCIKGYELFVQARDMPKKYHYIRTRLRIEQTRLLHWGEKIGLLEELLEDTSHKLELNRNLIIDVLLEINATFQSCVRVTAKYDKLVPDGGVTIPTRARHQDDLLKRTLKYWEKRKEVTDRLTWSMVNQDNLERATAKLIDLNDRIEGFLDKSAMHELQALGRKSNLLLLQLTEKLEGLTALADAVNMHGLRSSYNQNMISRSSTLVEPISEEDDIFADLAKFKIQQLAVETDNSKIFTTPLEAANLQLNSLNPTSKRHLIRVSGQAAWIEWHEALDDSISTPEVRQIIESRLAKLATILNSKSKPAAFRSPECLGYVRQEDEDFDIHYGLVYDASAYTSDVMVSVRSLRDYLRKSPKPSLTKRLALSCRLVESLMYLHAVNWIHKGLRSDNILFCQSADHIWEDADLYHPIVSGFEFSRPDLADEMTVKSKSRPEHDLYKHPDLLQQSQIHSQKSHDIYSLGIILIEIACWTPIEDLMGISLQQKGARAKILKVRETLLNLPFESYSNIFAAVESQAGEVYAAATRRCIEGGMAIGLAPHADEANPETGGMLFNAFHEDVLSKLQKLQI